MSRFTNNERLSQSSNYDRPTKTLQESLTEEQIVEKLVGYVRVDSIASVPANSHVRYFSLSTDPKTKQLRKLFRLGGFVTNKDHCDEYVILSNGTKSWSVQSGTSIFYRKLSQNEADEEHNRKLNDVMSKMALLESSLTEKNKIIERLVDTINAKKTSDRAVKISDSTMTIPIPSSAVMSAASAASVSKSAGPAGPASKSAKRSSRKTDEVKKSG
jgi:hypothetical protein